MHCMYLWFFTIASHQLLYCHLLPVPWVIVGAAFRFFCADGFLWQFLSVASTKGVLGAAFCFLAVTVEVLRWIEAVLEASVPALEPAPGPDLLKSWQRQAVVGTAAWGDGSVRR